MAAKFFALLVALLGVAAVSPRATRSTSNPEKVTFVLENGEVVEEDLTQPMPAPRAVEVSKLHFILYQQSNKANGYELKTGDTTNLKNSGFNSNLPTKIVIHGYSNNVNSDAVQVPKDAYLAQGKYNVIGVDYKEYNSPYLSAVSDAKSIAEKIGALVNFLAQNGGLKIQELHIIGHSLGAHIAGYVSGFVSTKIGRITGLDPAGPMFGTSGVNGRLDSGDASFVDVIHSSIQDLGITYSIGHVDFWPNGGKDQPRCGAVGGAQELVGGCDHAQAYFYFADSISKPTVYPAIRCSSDSDAKSGKCSGASTAFMGEIAKEKSSTGIYYVDVNSIFK